MQYLRDGELMCVYLQDSHVYLKPKPLERSALKTLTLYSVNLGSLKEFSVKKTENKDGGHENDGKMPGLNEVIHDVNNGIEAPVKWLLSHVFSGRILGSDAEDSQTSWFPRRSPEGQEVYEPLLLRRLIKIVGRWLLPDSEGNIVLPVGGSSKVGKLDKLPKNGGAPSSIVRVQRRRFVVDEKFRKKVHKVWDNEKLRLC